MKKINEDRPILERRIATFYRRWDSLEKTLGVDDGMIIDFDYCPDELVDDFSPFENRIQALRSLDAIRSDMSVADSSSFVNIDHLKAKLGGSEVYLRALMGQRFKLDEYIYKTLGIKVEPIEKSELDKLRQNVELELNKLQLRLDPQFSERYDELTRDDDVRLFGVSLRNFASLWVTFVKDLLELSALPEYRIDEVQEDAYWINFVNGKLGTPLRLRFNTHPRNTFRKGLSFRMAAHEVAAHLVNILELDSSRKKGLVDSPAVFTTLHTCELFQMEGLAQSLTHLLKPNFEGEDQASLEEAVYLYKTALFHQGHIDIEDGRAVDEVFDEIQKSFPFLAPMQTLSQLRDRSRNPTYRTLIFVYHPSVKCFLRAKKMTEENKIKFLRSMYQELWTPSQINGQIDALLV